MYPPFFGPAQPPRILETAGLAAQYMAFRLRHHQVSVRDGCMAKFLLRAYILTPNTTQITRTYTYKHTQGALICPSAADDDDEEEAAGPGPEAGASTGGSGKPRPRGRKRRLQNLACLLPLQQFGFPMRNLSLQRRMGYELLFYRGTGGGEEGREEGVKV